MRKLLARLGFFPLVWTRDFDDGTRLRIAYRYGSAKSDSPSWIKTNKVQWRCHHIDYLRFEPGLILKQDGTLESHGHSYAKTWEEWSGNKVHVTFKAEN